ncbi:hypothetical protein [Nonlabens marinus]|uniref:Uncharacterized protein n=1 Tax=Nonlabens marinus S1-08 TaxID=1454201 RepID=W8VP70_9FLAO|nr:hypothetical protein [Nonlabens marinus]BAO54869.1 hypothetical protein NMS_0860 [Nonlabens marinus S1-08]
MLSRFFSSSQPFHYLVGILLLGPTSILLLWLLNGDWQWSYAIIGLILPFALLLVQFIILKNELTGQNSYGLFAYTMLTLSVIVGIVEWKLAVCLLLFLLALRRLMSLKTGTSTIRKIFDGTFWISIATLLEPYMAIYFLAVFTAIFLFDRTKWRHWAIPIIAVVCVIVISFTLEIFLEQPILTRIFYRSEYGFNGLLKEWNPSDLLAWFLCATAVIGFVIYIIKLVDIQQRVRPRFSVLVIAGVCSLILALVGDAHFVLLLIPVISIFQVRALEHIYHRGFREFIFLLPALLIVLALLTQG